MLGILCCVGSSLVLAIGGYSSLLCAGFSLKQIILLWSMGSVVVAYGLSCSTACGILLDQASNPCLLHWQADSLPPSHQGNPDQGFFFSRVVPQRLLGRFLKYRVLASTLDQNQKLEEGLEICVFNPSKNLPGCSNMALALESVILDGVPTGA